MTPLVFVMCAAIEIVGDGQPRVHLETDGSPAAKHAAELLRKHVVLMTGVALPSLGKGHALRWERTTWRGYRITTNADTGHTLIAGDDLVRAAYDILARWGCRMDVEPPHIPRAKRLAITARDVPRVRDLFTQRAFDPTWPVQGWSVVGLRNYDAAKARAVAALGYRVAVASDTFDDFLDPALFEQHPEWFAKRGERRVPRGNFALLRAEARAAYLDALGAWLVAHPEVHRVGIWPEVTTVWDDDAVAAGIPHAYALLWREAAARFPKREFEILATGLTVRPPRAGRVPNNVVVRMRPGADASGWQPLRDQPLFAVVQGWRARGARVTLEIDAAPRPWCGLPWPCHQALRGNAALFPEAVLVRGSRELAALWREPDEPVTLGPLLARLLETSRSVRSVGTIDAAGALFLTPEDGAGYLVGEVERQFARARSQDLALAARRAAARSMYAHYRRALRSVPDAARYRRYRERQVRRLIHELEPEGIRYRVGPATITEKDATLQVETDTLAMRIDRPRATVTAVRRKLGREWSAWVGSEQKALFAVAALGQSSDRKNGRVSITSPATGVVRVVLHGRFGAAGATSTNALTFRNGSGLIHQTATTTARDGLVVGCRFAPHHFDHWVCPAYAVDGTMDLPLPSLHLPTETLLYCRNGARGLGLALRVTRASPVRLQLQDDEILLYTTTRANQLKTTWILFQSKAELAKKS